MATLVTRFGLFVRIWPSMFPALWVLLSTWADNPSSLNVKLISILRFQIASSFGVQFQSLTVLEACKVYSDSLLEHKESSQHHCAVLTVNMFSFSYYNLYYYYYYYTTTTTTTANLCPGGQIKAERYQLYMVEYFIHNNNFLKLFLKLRGPYDSFLRIPNKNLRGRPSFTHAFTRK